MHHSLTLIMCQIEIQGRVHHTSSLKVKRREEIEAQEQENLLGARNVEQERIQVG